MKNIIFKLANDEYREADRRMRLASSCVESESMARYCLLRHMCENRSS